jgi:DNA-binding beta-propeller fold protein YncE
LVHRWSSFFKSPQAVAVDPAGNVLVADQGNNRVLKLSPSGHRMSPWGTGDSGPNALNAPYSLALDGDGNLWVLDAGTPALHELSPGGKLIKQAQPGDAPSLLFGGLALDGHGNIDLTGGTASGVSVFSAPALSSSKTNSPTATYGSYGGRASEFRSPAGIAIDRQGNIYVADAGNNRIVVLSQSGRILFSVGTQGSGPGEFSSPGAIAVDGMGDVYVADTNNNRIQKLMPRA